MDDVKCLYIFTVLQTGALLATLFIAELAIKSNMNKSHPNNNSSPLSIATWRNQVNGGGASPNHSNGTSRSLNSGSGDESSMSNLMATKNGTHHSWGPSPVDNIRPTHNNGMFVNWRE